MSHLRPASQVVALGREERVPGAQVGAPLVLTSTYHAHGPVAYARVGNPTWSAFEEALGALEGGSAVCFASGMAAVDAALSLVPVGGRVVAPVVAYAQVLQTLHERSEGGRVHLEIVDPDDDHAVAAALPGADLVWIESPSNPLLDVSDVAALVAAARAAGAISVVDNTFATPLLQQPLALGADIVLHSATKYLAGHSDVILGALVIAGNHDDLLGRVVRHRSLAGSIPGPFEVWLALRGLRTLHLRVQRAGENAAELARRLADHPGVTRVRYPGFGAVVSIEIAGDAQAAEAVAGATSLWVSSTSLGGVESQIERRRRHPAEPLGVPEALLRLSVGIEDIEDLWADLEAALGAAG